MLCGNSPCPPRHDCEKRSNQSEIIEIEVRRQSPTHNKVLKHVSWQGGSRISRKGVDIHNGMGVRFADFISFFLNIPWKWNNLVSLRPNYNIFISYLKTGGQEGGSSDPPEPHLDPPLLDHIENNCDLIAKQDIKNRTIFSFYSLKCWLSRLETFVRIANREDPNKTASSHLCHRLVCGLWLWSMIVVYDCGLWLW